jgi:hypothetical protein
MRRKDKSVTRKCQRVVVHALLLFVRNKSMEACNKNINYKIFILTDKPHFEADRADINHMLFPFN